MQAVFFLALDWCAVSHQMSDHPGVPILAEGGEVVGKTLTQAEVWVGERLELGLKDVPCACFLAAVQHMANRLAAGEGPADDEQVRLAIVLGATLRAQDCEGKLKRVAEWTAKNMSTVSPGATAQDFAASSIPQLGRPANMDMGQAADFQWMPSPVMGGYGEDMFFGWTYDASMSGMIL